MNKDYCKYYVGQGKCLNGDCYVAKMPEETSEETIKQHVESCPSRKSMPIFLRALKTLETKV